MSQAIIITAIICGTVFFIFFLIIVAALKLNKQKLVHEMMEKEEKAVGFENHFDPEKTTEIINKSLNEILDEYEKKE